MRVASLGCSSLSPHDLTEQDLRSVCTNVSVRILCLATNSMFLSLHRRLPMEGMRAVGRPHRPPPQTEGREYSARRGAIWKHGESRRAPGRLATGRVKGDRGPGAHTG